MTIKILTTTPPMPRTTIKMDHRPIPTKMSINNPNPTHSNRNAMSPTTSKITTKIKILIKNIHPNFNRKNTDNHPINPKGTTTNHSPRKKVSKKSIGKIESKLRSMTPHSWFNAVRDAAGNSILIVFPSMKEFVAKFSKKRENSSMPKTKD